MHSFWQKLQSRSVFIFGVLVLLALILRLTNLTYTSLWQDEMYSLMVATMHNTIPPVLDMQVHPASYYLQQIAWQPMDFGKLLDILKDNVHMPLYYLLLNPWLKILGVDAFGLRTFSVLCSVLMLWPLYALAKSMFNERVALLAVFVAAVSPYQIYYAQEGRMYALAMLWAVVSTLCLWKILFSKKPAKWALGYAISVALGVLTHYIFVFFLGFHALSSIRSWNMGEKRFRYFIPAFVILLGIALWWYPEYQAQKYGVEAGYHFVKGQISAFQPFVALFWQPFIALGGDNEFIRLVYGFIFVFALVWAWAFKKPKMFEHFDDTNISEIRKNIERLKIEIHQWESGIFLFNGWVMVTVYSMVIYDLFSKTHMSVIDRYSVLIAPAVYILLASSFVLWLEMPKLKKITIAVMGVMLLIAIGNVWAPSPLRDEHNKKDIRAKIAYMGRHAGSNDLVLAAGVTATPVLGAYYLQGIKPDQPVLYWVGNLRGRNYPLPDMAMLKRYDRVWLLKLRATNERGGDDLQRMMRGNFKLRHTHHWDIYTPR